MSGGRRERDVNPDERQLKHFTELNKIRRASTIERLLFTFFPQEREREKKTHKNSTRRNVCKNIFTLLSSGSTTIKGEGGGELEIYGNFIGKKR